MSEINSRKGVFALTASHCAGMVDTIALPIWISVLITVYLFDPQKSGMIVTLFLLGATFASMFFASKFNSFQPKKLVSLGFFIAGLCFFACIPTHQLVYLAILHFIGGIATGMALSLTHGTMGRSLNPHKMFGIAGIAIGIFGLIFMSSALPIIQKWGGTALFTLLGIIMLIASFISALCFPQSASPSNKIDAKQNIENTPINRTVWFLIGGVVFFAITQSMTISFYERLGAFHGFNQGAITAALIIYGVVALIPAPLATLFQYKFKATNIICIAPILQALSVFIITHTNQYELYVIFGSMMILVLIFTHTFIFGLLAQLDPTGRAAAATPAMLMLGAALGPILGGTLVKFYGFTSLGSAAIVLVILQLVLFQKVRLNVKSHQSKKESSKLLKSC